MVRYILFVLKVPLNPKQTNKRPAFQGQSKPYGTNAGRLATCDFLLVIHGK